jgi:hypothetical protein
VRCQAQKPPKQPRPSWADPLLRHDDTSPDTGRNSEWIHTSASVRSGYPRGHRPRRRTRPFVRKPSCRRRPRRHRGAAAAHMPGSRSRTRAVGGHRRPPDQPRPRHAHTREVRQLSAKIATDLTTLARSTRRLLPSQCDARRGLRFWRAWWIVLDGFRLTPSAAN